tara:strand:- start:409 stop:990 length:582 start_codon:yes stop_codon:yes gene_type:complete
MEFYMSVSFSAFTPKQCLITGSLEEAALAAFHHLRSQSSESVMIFNDETYAIMDIDLSGDAELVKRKAASYPTANTPAKKGPGRPKLGVIGKEVTLLPRHWEWLASQQGGPSVTLRKLIDAARRDPQIIEQNNREQAQNLTYKFCNAIAGDLPGFEEALRCLYAKDKVGFSGHLSEWPIDIAGRANFLAQATW